MFAAAARQGPSQSNMLDLEFFHLSDVGRVRDHNEDFVGSFIPASETEGRSQGWLFVVADGVGGEEKGEVASQSAVESLIAGCLLYTSPSPRDGLLSRMPSSA